MFLYGVETKRNPNLLLLIFPEKFILLHLETLGSDAEEAKCHTHTHTHTHTQNTFEEAMVPTTAVCWENSTDFVYSEYLNSEKSLELYWILQDSTSVSAQGSAKESFITFLNQVACGQTSFQDSALCQDLGTKHLPSKHLALFKRFYLFVFRERGREREREEGNINVWLPRACPAPGYMAYDPGMCPDWEWNQQPSGSQAGTQSTEPHQWGITFGICLTALGKFAMLCI